MEDILELAMRNQAMAWEIIRDTDIYAIWQHIGAEVNLVGSLKSGLLTKHRDIDFHIYTDPLNLSESFSVMATLAGHPAIERIEFKNLIQTEECIEWHAWYRDREGNLWQIDMIHLMKGSIFDGHVERFTDRIMEILTPETQQAILQIKYDLPDVEKVWAIEIYRAVLDGNVRTYEEFLEWRKNFPVNGVLKWMP